MGDITEKQHPGGDLEHVQRHACKVHHYENVFTLNHNIEKSSLDRCSGCISWKNVSSPFIRIYHRPQQNNTYQYIVQHRHYQINSIAGSDGPCPHLIGSCD